MEYLFKGVDVKEFFLKKMYLALWKIIRYFNMGLSVMQNEKLLNKMVLCYSLKNLRTYPLISLILYVFVFF